MSTLAEASGSCTGSSTTIITGTTSASKITYIVSGGALNFTHSLITGTIPSVPTVNNHQWISTISLHTRSIWYYIFIRSNLVQIFHRVDYMVEQATGQQQRISMQSQCPHLAANHRSPAWGIAKQLPVNKLHTFVMTNCKPFSLPMHMSLVMSRVGLMTWWSRQNCCNDNNNNHYHYWKTLFSAVVRPRYWNKH